MSAHWSNVEMCAGLLAFCVTRYDKDGVDLCFMFSEDKKNTGGDDSIMKMIRKNRPPDVSPGSTQSPQQANINSVLSNILGAYQTKLENYYQRGSRLPGKRPKKLKKLVLFVFTDGLWLPHSDAERPLKDLVSTLNKYKCPQNQVGVQFIHFGNDQHGHQRLSKLDDFLDK
jgi:hypothetical protein